MARYAEVPSVEDWQFTAQVVWLQADWLAAEDQGGKLRYGGDADQQIGDRAEQIVPAIEWFQQRHCSITILQKGFALVTAGGVLRKDAASRMPEKRVRVYTANPVARALPLKRIAVKILRIFVPGG